MFSQVTRSVIRQFAFLATFACMIFFSSCGDPASTDKPEDGDETEQDIIEDEELEAMEGEDVEIRDDVDEDIAGEEDPDANESEDAEPEQEREPDPRCIGRPDLEKCDDDDPATMNDLCFNEFCSGQYIGGDCTSNADCYADTYCAIIEGRFEGTCRPARTTTLGEHAFDLAYSPSGNMLAVSANNYVKIINIETWEIIRVLAGQPGEIRHIAFSPDGQLIAAANREDNTVKLWRIENGALVHTLSDLSGEVTAVAFSPDGTVLATGGATTENQGDLRLWRISNGTLIRSLTGHTGSVVTVDFSPDGLSLASGGGDTTIILWRISDGSIIRSLSGHSDCVDSVAFSPDGTILASAGKDNVLLFWDVADGSIIRTFDEPEASAGDVTFSPDGSLLAAGYRNYTARLWQVSDGALLHTLSGHKSSVTKVAFSPDGQHVVTAGGTDDTVKRWNVSDGELLNDYTGHTGTVFSMAFSPNGGIFASASTDKTVKLWDVSSGRMLRSIHKHSNSVTSVAFSKDGETIASGSWDNSVRFCRVDDGSLFRVINGHTAEVLSISYSPDDTMIASGSADTTIKLWNVETEELIRTFSGHTEYVNSVDISSDGQWLASGSGDNTAKIWRISDGSVEDTVVMHREPVWTVAFSPDSTKLVTGSLDRSIRVWKVPSGTPYYTLDANFGEIRIIAFSVDGKMFATGSCGQGESVSFCTQGEIKIWRTVDGRLLRILAGHRKYIFALAFSPDGSMLASGGADDNVRIWDIGDMATICHDELDCPEGNTCINNECVSDTSDGDIDEEIDADSGDQDNQDIEVDLSGFVRIEAGSFMMGSRAGEAGRDLDELRHQVTLTYDFEMKITEVTQAEWTEAFPGTNPSWFGPNADGPECGPDCPVERVNWYEALAYANWLSEQSNLSACYVLNDCSGVIGEGCPSEERMCYGSADVYKCESVELNGVSIPQNCQGYRLPTEAEWEYAARAGTTTAYYSGEDSDNLHSVCEFLENLANIAWYCGNSWETTHPVGEKIPNAWGLYDMSGNVAEWGWDWYDDYAETATDPVGPGNGYSRTARGGNFMWGASGARSACRFGRINPGRQDNYRGFRLVRTLP